MNQTIRLYNDGQVWNIELSWKYFYPGIHQYIPQLVLHDILRCYLDVVQLFRSHVRMFIFISINPLYPPRSVNQKKKLSFIFLVENSVRIFLSGKLQEKLSDSVVISFYDLWRLLLVRDNCFALTKYMFGN